LFIGWGDAVRGREQNATKVFGEAIEFWTRLQESGEIESWTATFLEPHGGDLAGFFLIWGERDAVARIRASDEMAQLNLRASLIVENFGVVGAERGARIETQMGWFRESADELG
jgi:uncharacterized protein with GYD domain